MRVCRVCLARDADCRLYYIVKHHQLLEAYKWLSGADSALSDDELICSQCATLLKRCVNLRDMCHSSYKQLLRCTQVTDENFLSNVRLKSKTPSLMPAIEKTLFYQEIKENENFKPVIREIHTESCVFHKLFVNVTKEVSTDEVPVIKTEIKIEKTNLDDLFSDSDNSIGATEDIVVMIESKQDVLKCEFDKNNVPMSDNSQSNSELEALKTKLQQGNVTFKTDNKPQTKPEMLKSHYLHTKHLGESQKKSPLLNLLAKLGNNNNKLPKPDILKAKTEVNQIKTTLKSDVSNLHSKTSKCGSQSKIDNLLKTQSGNFKSNKNENKTGINESKPTSKDIKSGEIGKDSKNIIRNIPNLKFLSKSTEKRQGFIIRNKHSSQKPPTFMCEQCGHIAKTKKHLEEHSKSHVKKTRFKCNRCNRIFKKKSVLIQHIRDDHTEKASFLCQYCSYQAEHKSSLLSHERKHTGDKPFKCNVCKKSFTQKGTLQRHVTIHTGDRPFKCSICSSSFRQKMVLNVHMRTHTGEKPYKCHMCTMAFAQGNNLKNHINTHTGMKPYTCSICDRSFAERSTLSKHIKTHKGEAPCVPTQLLVEPKDKLFKNTPGLYF